MRRGGRSGPDRAHSGGYHHLAPDGPAPWKRMPGCHRARIERGSLQLLDGRRRLGFRHRKSGRASLRSRRRPQWPHRPAHAVRGTMAPSAAATMETGRGLGHGVSRGFGPLLGRPLRSTGSTGALGLRDALEIPAAAQAGEMANALGPHVDGISRCPALKMHHLSVLEDAVGAEEHRGGANRTRRAQRGHGSRLSVQEQSLRRRVIWSWRPGSRRILTQGLHEHSARRGILAHRAAHQVDAPLRTPSSSAAAASRTPRPRGDRAPARPASLPIPACRRTRLAASCSRLSSPPSF